MNANVVNHCGQLGDILCARIYVLLACNELREAMYFHEMLNAHRIALVILYHGKGELINDIRNFFHFCYNFFVKNLRGGKGTKKSLVHVSGNYKE